MGKCKRRTLNNKTNVSYFMTRETAVNNIFRMITEDSKKRYNSKKKFDLRQALSTISLFGISAEELSEAGVPYENLKALGSIPQTARHWASYSKGSHFPDNIQHQDWAQHQ